MIAVTVRTWCLVLVISASTALILFFQSSILSRFMPQLDYGVYLSGAYQFSKAIEEGFFYPSWVFAAHDALGEPTQLFYYQPLFYYLISGLDHFLSNVALSFRLTLLLSNILLGIATFITFRSLVSVSYALIGMILIQITPVLFFLETYGSAFPWFFASPFMLLFARESAEERPRALALMFWLGLLLLSHILSAFMALLSIGIGNLLSARPWSTHEARVRFSRWVIGAICGLLSVSFYLYPAFSQQDFFRLNAWNDGQFWGWRRAFAFPILSYFQFGARWFVMQWPLPILALFSTIAGIWILNTSNTNNTMIAKRITGYALIALFFSSELAYPLYAASAVFQKIQQPYRFVIPATLFSALALGICFPDLLRRQQMQWPKTMAYVSIGLCLVTAIILQIGLFKADRLPPNLHDVIKGEFAEPDYLFSRQGNDWPKYLKQGGWREECAARELTCTAEQRSTHSWSASVFAKEQNTVRLPLFFFPSWSVIINGKTTPAQADAGTGLMLISIPPGQHAIRVIWQTLPEEKIGYGLSVLGLLLALLVTFSSNAHRVLKLELVSQFLKFGTVGALGTACHYSLLIIMVSGLGLQPVFATSCGAILGAVVNYVLNRYFTFRSTRKHSEALPRFILLATTGLVLNALIMAWLVNFGVFYLLAQVIATGFVLILNYIVSRVWIFH